MITIIEHEKNVSLICLSDCLKLGDFLALHPIPGVQCVESATRWTASTLPSKLSRE